jgi:hypothetical protein
MKVAFLAAIAGLLAATCALAQKLELKFDGLAARASTKVELDFDSKLLRLAMGMSGDTDVNGLLAGVQAIHVRNYEFAKPGAYSQKDLDPLHDQVAAQSRWSRILAAKEEDETVEIYVAAQGDKVTGCLIVSTEETALSVIYLEGTLALAQMKRLIDEDTRHELGALFDNH